MQEPAKGVLVYDYTQAKTECIASGLVMNYPMLIEADTEFVAAGLSQKQVNLMMSLYIRMQVHLWSPRNYKWYQRLMMAFHWLFRRTV